MTLEGLRQLHMPARYGGCRSTAKRGPQQPLAPLTAALGELRQPVYGHTCVGELDHDLTRNARRPGDPAGEPIGEHMVLAGRVLDDRGRPVPRGADIVYEFDVRMQGPEETVFFDC